MRSVNTALMVVRSAGALAVGFGFASSAVADTIRCMALSGTQAAALPAGVRYGSLDQPSIGADGTILFRGSLQIGQGGVTNASDSAIWLARAGGPTSVVAREGSSTGGTPAGAIYVEFGHPGLDPLTDSAAFWARLQGSGIGPTNDRAIFRYLNGSNQLHMQCGSMNFGVAEGPISNLDDFRDHPTVHFGGQPTLRANLVTGPGGVPVDQAAGIWSPDVSGDVIVIAQQGSAAPEMPPGVVFEGNFSTPVMSRRGDVGYRANLRRGVGGVDATNDLGIWVWIPAESVGYWIARTNQPLGHGDVADAVLETIGEPVITGEPRLGFHATMRIGVAGITATNDEGLFTRCPCGSVFLYAREGQQAQGLPDGTVYNTFSDPIFSEDGRMMFASTLRGTQVHAGNDTSVWWSDSTVNYVMAAREGSLAPGGDGATFAHIDFAAPDFWIGSTLANQLAFSATLSSGVRGVWSMTPGRGVRCVVKEGDSVEVGAGDIRQIISITPWTEGTAHSGRRTPLSNDGHVAFHATVTGGATGIFLATLPPPIIGCSSDWNNDAFINSQDFFDFIGDFFSGAADVNTSGFTDSQDLFDFLTAFFSGC
ncbi:MAG: hypothetical protein H7210_02025 [Pyrinomonadaceae bacterium]|nr:hypothetical protein [Phycisphaerales bacterium]